LHLVASGRENDHARPIGFFRKTLKLPTIDRVRVNFPDRRGLARGSDTQPALLTPFEATSEKRLAGIRALFDGKLRERAI